MRIAVGMSGGVDSSVTTLLLKEQGYDVIGLTMKLWKDESRCCSLDDIYTAKRVAAKLGIPHYTIDLRDTFKQEVVDYFVNEYTSGRTPNPCVVCNQKIKFGALLKKAKAFNAEYIATGHYARVEKRADRILLKRGKDKEKDQSYFLSMLSQESLANSIFPLGEYTKEKVRELGMRLDVDKNDSQEVCFIPDGDYVEFIRTQNAERITHNANLRGPIIDKTGNVVGEHKGIINYTIGQRTGIGIPASNPFSKPLYVIGINTQENAIIVGEEGDLLCKSFLAERVNWIGIPTLNSLRCEVQVRYRVLPAKALLTPKGNEVLVEFDTPQKSITPGQLAVFYKDDTVLGAGWLKAQNPSHLK